MVCVIRACTPNIELHYVRHIVNVAIGLFSFPDLLQSENGKDRMLQLQCMQCCNYSAPSKESTFSEILLL